MVVTNLWAGVNFPFFRGKQCFGKCLAAIFITIISCYNMLIFKTIIIARDIAVNNFSPILSSKSLGKIGKLEGL